MKFDFIELTSKKVLDTVEEKVLQTDDLLRGKRKTQKKLWAENEIKKGKRKNEFSSKKWICKKG
jgi:hypothetical protein